jgi:hypothetical protein
LRKLSILTCLVLLASPLVVTQANAATPKLGGTCSKVGSFGDTPKERFICVKSGKKLVWQKWDKSSLTNNSANKGDATPTPAPSAAPTNVQIAGSSCTTAGAWKTVGNKRYYCEGTNRMGNFLWDKGTPTSFNAPMPITLPVGQSGTITFANALSHISEISTVSWQRIQDIIDKTVAVNIPHQLLVGPQTTTVTKSVEETILAREFKLWSGFQQTHYLTVIAYNFSDMNWAATTNDALVLSKGYSGDNSGGINRAKQSCHEATNCDGGNAGQVVAGDDAIEFLGVTTTYPWNPTSNGEVGHEYTHTVTSAQFIGTAAKNQNYYEQMFMPCWMNEGLSNASGIGASATSLREYLDSRDGQVTHLGTLPPEFKGFTAAGLKDFLTTQNSSQSTPNNCYQNGPLYQLGYSIGFAATEALFAIGGPQSVMALVSRGVMGDNFSQAFQNVYGITWDEGSTILGKILAAEYAAKPMRT